jgi:hypothetical protein
MAEYESVDKPYIGEYKDKATIVIGTGKNKFPWSFGQQKAQAIVENFEAIREFAETGALSQ